MPQSCHVSIRLCYCFSYCFRLLPSVPGALHMAFPGYGKEVWLTTYARLRWRACQPPIGYLISTAGVSFGKDVQGCAIVCIQTLR